MRYTAACLTASTQSAEDNWAARIADLTTDYADLELVVVPALAHSSHDVTLDLSAAAKEHSLHIAGAIGTQAFLFSPEGEDMLADVAEDFPVVNSAIGDLAVVVGDDLRIHEVVRGHMFNGAEIILNPIRERPDAVSYQRDLARSARAYENLVAVLTASAGGTSGAWDSRGECLVSGGPAHDAVSTKIDLEALRAERMVAPLNFPAQLRTKLYANAYTRAAERAQTWGTPTTPSVAPYQALIVQAHITTVPSIEQADEVIKANMDRSLGLAGKFAAGPNIKLVVFPEYWMTGVPFGRSVDDFWPHVGIRMDGPHFARLQEFAQQTKTYVGGAMFEYDPDWPRRWFNTAFILNPSGDVILKYRKIQCGDINGMLNNTTPGNVYSEYVQRYGEEGLFPVVETEIGRLAACVCYDTNFPELWRVLTLRGAELIVYPTGEPHHVCRAAWEIAKQAHAAENQIYIASANAGCEASAPGAPTTYFHRGFSKLVGPEGRIAGVADTAGEVPLIVNVDIENLRRLRADADLSLIDKIDFSAAAKIYTTHDGFPLDWALESPTETAFEGIGHVMKTMERYRETGVYRAPSEAA
ncbi:MAG: nitrilase-related carbon-nitrogen hydrolase [Rhodospirillaceae bacterium]